MSESSENVSGDQSAQQTSTVLRTPDACFDNLPLWDYKPQYFMSRLYGMDVRIAYYDLGDKGGRGDNLAHAWRIDLVVPQSTDDPTTYQCRASRHPI